MSTQSRGPRQRTDASFQPGLAIEDDGVPLDAPLAARMRPRSLEEFIGQDAAVGPNSMLRGAIQRGTLPSIILWGPPGCGKTTLARLLTKGIDAAFVPISAVSSGVADLRRVVSEATARRAVGKRTVVFVDEIHRFNKAQQDVLLPARGGRHHYVDRCHDGKSIVRSGCTAPQPREGRPARFTRRGRSLGASSTPRSATPNVALAASA